jgi:hypothetical protein
MAKDAIGRIPDCVQGVLETEVFVDLFHLGSIPGRR